MATLPLAGAACGRSPSGAAQSDLATSDLAGGDGGECGTGWWVPYSGSTPPGDRSNQCASACCTAGHCMGFYECCSTAAPTGGLCCRNCYSGRRPAGLLAETAPPPAATGELGAWLAELARLEAASVAAFEQLGDELRAHRAPRRLVDGAARAAADEVRHARTVAALARRFGGTPVRPAVVAPSGVRPLAAIAVENAVEGCVRETFGALVALWQSRRAGDAVLRAAMVRIAEDETRHAELALEIATWTRARLGAAERRAVDHARRDAIAELRRSVVEEPAAIVESAGVPRAVEARALLDGLFGAAA